MPNECCNQRSLWLCYPVVPAQIGELNEVTIGNRPERDRSPASRSIVEHVFGLW